MITTLFVTGTPLNMKPVSESDSRTFNYRSPVFPGNFSRLSTKPEVAIVTAGR